MNIINNIIESKIERLKKIYDSQFECCEPETRRRNEEKIETVQIYAQQLREKIIPPGYLETSNQHEGWNQEAYALAVDWWTLQFHDLAPGGKYGLLLYGDTGSCKTRILYCLAAHFAIEDGKNPLVFRPGVLHTRVEASMRFDENTLEELYDKCRTAKVLMIDDLGKEIMSPRYQSFIFEIIEDRQAFKRPTVLTMNHSGAEFSAKLGMVKGSDRLLIEPLVRRFKEGFLTIDCNI